METRKMLSVLSKSLKSNQSTNVWINQWVVEVESSQALNNNNGFKVLLKGKNIQASFFFFNSIVDIHMYRTRSVILNEICSKKLGKRNV